MTVTPTRAYGWKRDVPDPRDYRLAEHVDLVEVEELPTAVDLRTGGHLGFGLYDQGALGSCTSNAIAAALRYEAGVQQLADEDPSRLWIYYKERSLEGTVGEDSGAQIRDGLKVVATEGWPLESEWPYDIARFADRPPAQVDEDAKADMVTKYMRVDVAPDALKQALATGLAVVVGFDVYESFEWPETAGSGIVPMPGPNEQLLGGHAVLCVGYDDAKQRFLCRNSWGPAWGQAGYFEMPYAYLGDPTYAQDFWAVQQEIEGGTPPPSPTPSPGPTPPPSPSPAPTPGPNPPPPPPGIWAWLEQEAERLPEPFRDWIEAALHAAEGQ